ANQTRIEQRFLGRGIEGADYPLFARARPDRRGKPARVNSLNRRSAFSTSSRSRLLNRWRVSPVRSITIWVAISCTPFGCLRQVGQPHLGPPLLKQNGRSWFLWL